MQTISAPTEKGKTMKETTHECKNCVHGYYLESCGFHNLCGAGKCYLCHEQYGGECDEYIEGKPPEGKEPM